MIKDSFLLDGDIEVGIELAANNGMLDISIAINNNSTDSVTFHNSFFMTNNFFYFRYANGEQGVPASGGNIRSVQWDFRVHHGTIVTIEPGMSWQFETQERYEREGNHVTMRRDMAHIVYDLSREISITILNRYHRDSAERVREFVLDGVLLPAFRRTFVINSILRY